MLKKTFLSLICTILFASVSGQGLVERISVRICSCIDTIENMDSLQAKFNRCVTESVSVFWNSDSDDEPDSFAPQDSISNTIDSVIAKLSYYCPKIRAFILADKEAHFYKMSDSEKANKFYTAGNDAFEKNDFKTAEKQYIKAINADPGWVYPYDNLGLTYRNMKQFKKAVKYYDKSLKIYPENSFAIQNQAVAFTFLKDNARALDNYVLLINLYPNNPEGYYGAAKIHILNEDYETALNYVFYCHNMYVALKSEYVKDTEQLAKTIYNKMKEQNKLDIFMQKAKEYGITINETDKN
jgi:tetratricopeptide (TPR) repeat protein